MPLKVKLEPAVTVMNPPDAGAPPLPLNWPLTVNEPDPTVILLDALVELIVRLELLLASILRMPPFKTIVSPLAGNDPEATADRFVVPVVNVQVAIDHTRLN